MTGKQLSSILLGLIAGFLTESVVVAFGFGLFVYVCLALLQKLADGIHRVTTKRR